VTPRSLREHGAVKLTANAAQLSIRDLRLRPLRAVVQVPRAEPEQSPLEAALLKYLDEQP
jgi:hypothetical protein